jgi:hypothetical protein
MQKDPLKFKDFVIFEFRTLQNNFLDIFWHMSAYMNFEINRPLKNIW